MICKNSVTHYHLPYNLTDKVKLEEVLTLTTHSEQRVSSLVPTESGLLLRPPSTSSIIARKLNYSIRSPLSGEEHKHTQALPRHVNMGNQKLLDSARRIKVCMHTIACVHVLMYHISRLLLVYQPLHRTLNHRPQLHHRNSNPHQSQVLWDNP